MISSPRTFLEGLYDLAVAALTLYDLLAHLIADNPFAKQSVRLDAYVNALPQVSSVAENNGTTVMQIAGQYMMRSPDGTWSSLEGIER